MREMGLSGQAPCKGCRTTDSEHSFTRYPNLAQDLDVVRPEQVWACDITYVRLKLEFICLAVIMDVFTRGIRGWNLSRNLDQELTLTALESGIGVLVSTTLPRWIPREPT